jgi:hypothetical protein
MPGFVEYESDSQLEEFDDARPIRPRQGHAGNQKAISFGKAMIKLHQQIERAEQFYGQFRDEYNTDIQGIKRYVTDENLLTIWVLRVKGQRDPKVAGNQDEEEQQLAEAAERFPSFKKKLRDAFSEALCSTMNQGKTDRKAAIRLDSAKRLKEKVVLAHSQILDLLDLLPKAPEHCEEMLRELGELRTLIDPTTEKNQELYGGGDGNGEAGEAGGGGGEWDN